MRIAAKFCWVLAVIGALFGIVVLVSGIFYVRGADRQTVAFISAIALAAVPYCLAKAVTEIGKLDKEG